MNPFSVDTLLALSNGHAGARNFLAQLMQSENKAYADSVLPTLTRIASLKGANLYFLWSDLCQEDMHTIAVLCEICPDQILADACSRWDDMGHALVRPYLPESD